jgi:small subunit ribosomal protein S5
MREKEYRNKEESELKEKVIQISRVTKVVKGGKKMSFRAVVVVGDLKASVGVGIGKANEVSPAIRKAVEAAKKNMFKVVMSGYTIPHDILGKFGASMVILKPAPQGTGVIAGGSVRTILELAGIKDIVAKSTGSNNTINLANAALAGLKLLKDIKVEEQKRNKKLNVQFVR